MRKKLIKIFSSIPMSETATKIPCFGCPLKWDCKKWFFHHYDINGEMCNSTNEKEIFFK